eukprot:g31327.t1
MAGCFVLCIISVLSPATSHPIFSSYLIVMPCLLDLSMLSVGHLRWLMPASSTATNTRMTTATLICQLLLAADGAAAYVCILAVSV